MPVPPGRRTATASPAPGLTRERAVLILAAVLFFWFLWGHDLWAPDEPFFAEGAREMLAGGHWLVTFINGVVNSHKPPLFFWLIAAFSAPFGQILEVTARLPSALAALGTLALTMRLGRRFWDRDVAALAGIVLATSYMFWDKARWAQIDSLLCFLIWVALAAFAAYRAGEADGRRAGLLFWLAAALATLAKGPVGLLLPLGIALLTLASDRDLRRWRRFAPVLGPLLFVAVTGAWVLAVTVAGPDGYTVWGALREHFVNRAIHGMHHRQPVYYYLLHLPVSLLPWSGLLPGALLLAWRRRRAAGDRFLAVAAIFVVVFFSISTEKRDLYVLPAFPAMALLIASLVAAVGRRRNGRDGSPVDPRWVTVAQVVIGAVVALAGLAVPVAVGRYPQVPAAVGVLLGAVLVVTGAATAWQALRRRVLGSVLAPAAGMLVLYLLVPPLLYPAFEPIKSARPLAVEVRRVTAPSRAAGHDVVAYDVGNLPVAIAFYSDGVYTRETLDPDVLTAHLESSARVFALVNARSLERIPASLRERMVVIDRANLAHRDVLFVANR